MDITAVFGTAIGGSNPSGSINELGEFMCMEGFEQERGRKNYRFPVEETSETEALRERAQLQVQQCTEVILPLENKATSPLW